MYHDQILLRLAESTYTGYPFKIQYSLFDPSTLSFVDLPSAIVDYFTIHPRIQMRAIDDILFVIDEGLLFYYSEAQDALVPVMETAIDSTGMASTYLYVISNEKHDYVFGVDGCVQIVEEQKHLPLIHIRIPNTYQMYYADETEQGYEIHRLDLLHDCDEVIVSGLPAQVDLMMLSIGNQGQFLYYRMSDNGYDHVIKRFDLANQINDESFVYEMHESENEYISNIIIQNDEMICVMHQRNGSNRLEISDLFDE